MISGGAGHRNRTYNDAKDRPQKTIQLANELLLSWRHSSNASRKTPKSNQNKHPKGAAMTPSIHRGRP